MSEKKGDDDADRLRTPVLGVPVDPLLQSSEGLDSLEKRPSPLTGSIQRIIQGGNPKTPRPVTSPPPPAPQLRLRLRTKLVVAMASSSRPRP